MLSDSESSHRCLRMKAYDRVNRPHGQRSFERGRPGPGLHWVGFRRRDRYDITAETTAGVTFINCVPSSLYAGASPCL